MKSKRSRSSSENLKKLIIDTSVLIDLIKKRKIEELLKYSGANISIITLFEFLRGIKTKQGRLRAAKDLRKLFNIIGLDEFTVILAAEIYKQLEQKGQPLHDDGDLLIGATAIAKGYTLWTKNKKHFKRLEPYGLKLY